MCYCLVYAENYIAERYDSGRGFLKKRYTERSVTDEWLRNHSDFVRGAFERVLQMGMALLMPTQRGVVEGRGNPNINDAAKNYLGISLSIDTPSIVELR